jgi:hypothetical protein
MATPHKTNTRLLALIFSWSAVLLCMAGIFLLSHQTAEESSELSRGLLKALMETLRLDIPHAALRAMAHGAVFFTLAVPVYIAMRLTLRCDAVLPSFALCVFYALRMNCINSLYPDERFSSGIFCSTPWARRRVSACVPVSPICTGGVKRRNRR